MERALVKIGHSNLWPGSKELTQAYEKWTTPTQHGYICNNDEGPSSKM